MILEGLYPPFFIGKAKNKVIRKAKNNLYKIMLRFYVKLYKARQEFYYLYIDKQLNDMKVNIKGKEIELHYSMRIHILYENVMNQSLSAVQNKTTSLVVLMYCAIVASIQKARLNLPLSYEDFMDWIDEQGPDIFSEFSKWFTESVEAYSGLKLKEEDKKDQSTEKADPNA